MPLLGSRGGTFRHLEILRLTKNWSIQTKGRGVLEGYSVGGEGYSGGSYLRASQGEVPGQGGDNCSQGIEGSVSGTYIGF